MGFKGLLLSFLSVGAVTGTVVGGYCIFRKSNTKSTKIEEKPDNRIIQGERQLGSVSTQTSQSQIGNRAGRSSQND